MKNSILIIFLSTFFIVGCDTLNKVIDTTNNVLGSTESNSNPLSNEEVIAGLKEALTIGIQNGSGKASALDGFLKNEKIRLPFPPDAQKVKDKALQLGLDNKVQEFETTLNRAAEEAANIILKTDPSMSNDIESFSITSINSGLAINKLIFSKNDLKNKNRIPNETILIEKVASKDLYNNEYLPKLVFPIIANSFTPQGLHHIGSPERFYYGGLALKIDTSVLFSRKLSLESNFNLNIYNEFDRKINKPDSALPHVRSEVVRYLQESENYFSKLQLNYNDEFIDDFYYRLSGGIYENMFAGIGGELLYSPFEKDFAFGVNIYKVRQRDYDQLFNFLDYETTTGHFNFYYTEPRSKITAHISYGRYLAKDDGYTIDFSRGFRNGSTIGAFFTITDVPRELFGEGSFDKGFYFKIPINLFTKDDRVGGFSWAMRPLTRDGGQKLEDTGNLYGLIYGSKYNEIKSFINYLNEE